MPYNYNARITELTRILGIPYLGVRMHALQNFISIENQILRSLDIPQNRSQALDSAEARLQQLMQPVAEERPVFAVRLF